MIKKWQVLSRSLLALFLVAGVMVGSGPVAKEKPGHERDADGSSFAKTFGYQPDRYQILNINNLWTWAREDGLSNHSPTGDNGTFFPRGTAFLIYQDGFVFGSKAYVDEAHTQPAPFSQTIRVGGATYGTGTREGWVNGFGASAQFVDPADPRARIYRIRRDWKEMSPEELRRDAAESNEIPVSDVTDTQVQQIVDRYQKDWNEWPVDLGAPFIDRNGNGVYDPPPADFAVADLIEKGYDEPGLAGADPNSPADQVIWTVFNDLHRPTSTGRFGSEPTGLEIQVTIWGYKRTDALGNIFFRKWRIINKGGVEIDAAGNKGVFYLDSMYVCQWSDPDLGSFSDDLVGCDTTLSMGFVYNGNAIDTDFRKFNLPPPAGGYDFLQGPIVPSPGDVAVFDLKYKQDFKNLGMTGFSYFSAGSPYSDPRGGYDTNTILWYKMLRGYAPLEGPDVRYAFPPGMEPGPFPLAGDPVTGTGHIDGQGQDYSFVPGDRRLLVITGPFELAPGDTQEVVVAFVAGLGSDRLSSISVMKFNDRFAQNTYDALFQVPKAPAAPNVKVTELDGEILLDWGSDLARVAEIEETVNEPGGYRFEGYNVYQLPSPTSSLSEAKRVVTYDVKTDPTVVLDERFDVSSGQILEQPVQFGSNSGIFRYFKFDRDYVLDVDKLNNGQDYYLAVTAYSVSTVPGFLPASLESDVRVLTARPKVPFGAVYQTAFGDTLEVEHVGGSFGWVAPIVIDPVAASTGNSYEVTFKEIEGEAGKTSWTLRNTTTGANLLVDETNQAGDENYKIVDGMFLKVFSPPPGIGQVIRSVGPEDGGPGGVRWISGTNWGGGWLFGGMDLGANFFGSTLGPLDLVDVDWRFTSNPTMSEDTGWSRAYVYRRDLGYAFVSDQLGWFPGQMFDISDLDNPRQLNVVFVEDANGGLADGIWNPIEAETVGGDPGGREYLFCMASDYNPDGGVYNDDNWGPAADVLYALWPNNRGSHPFQESDFWIRIIANRPNTPNDVFKFNTPEVIAGPEQARLSAEKVGVFPNPYYAFNPLETNRLSRFVTFNNLPPKATIRIFNLAGQLVRRLEKDDDSQFMNWNLLNHSGLPVASGMYIAHVEMPEVGVNKVLKLVIVQEAEVLETF